MPDVQATISEINQFQAAFSIIAPLLLTSDRFPSDTDTEDLLPFYDVIVVGGGSAGCVVASRLTENPNNTVLLIEAGGPPPIESLFAGLFPMQVNSRCDSNLTSKDDGVTAQYMVDKVMALELGHMLGGSSSINHMMMIRGNKYDFERWVNKTGDISWSYENLLKYFIKIENVRDPEIIKEYPSSHGTSGPVFLTRQKSTKNIPILNAFKELNNTILIDINNINASLGFFEPLFTLNRGIRYTAAEAYISPNINRTNLCVKYNTLVNKIIFDSNNKATGVAISDSKNVTRIIKANKEIIVSAGAVNTPQLLTLSGIGDKKIIDALGIDLVTDLPVGQNLIDHCGTVMVYPLGKTNKTTTTDYHDFPVPVTMGSVGLNSSTYPIYHTVNLLFPQNSSSVMQFFTWVLKYNETICEKIYEANLENDLLVVVIYLIHPFSRGQVTINSTDPNAPPTVELGLLSDERDLDYLGQSLFHFNSISKSSYFRENNSTMLDFKLKNCNNFSDTIEYFTCYGREMSKSLWHLCGSCAMGTVLNTDLSVKNTTGLYVVDASSMPDTVSGKTLNIIYAVAEKFADFIQGVVT